MSDPVVPSVGVGVVSGSCFPSSSAFHSPKTVREQLQHDVTVLEFIARAFGHQVENGEDFAFRSSFAVSRGDDDHDGSHWDRGGFCD